MSLTEKLLDVAWWQLTKLPVVQEALKVWETLWIKQLTGSKLTEEETKVQLDLFKKNFAQIAEKLLGKDQEKISQSIDKAVNNEDWFLAEIALQRFEKDNYVWNVDKLITALQELKIEGKLGSDFNLDDFKTKLVSIAPDSATFGLGKIPLIGKLFVAQGGTLKQLNEWFAKINEALISHTTNTEQQSSEQWDNITTSLEWFDGTVESLKGKLLWPLQWDDIYLTSEKWHFGDDRGDHIHAGIDLGGESDEIVAPHTMEITKIDYQEGGAWHYVVAQVYPHTQPPVVFKFFHLKDKPDLTIGQVIQQWEVVATEWNTGRSTGEHLHFELWIDGKAQDPLKAFDQTQILYKQWWSTVAFEDRNRAHHYKQSA